MGHRPNPKEEPVGWRPPELAGLLQEAAPHPRHRLLILPAAQQLRLGVASLDGCRSHRAPIRRGMHCNQQPRTGRIPLALIAVSHVAAVPSALSLAHLATQAFTLPKPSARQDAWHFDWQSESHPLAWPLTCGTAFGATTVG